MIIIDTCFIIHLPPFAYSISSIYSEKPSQMKKFKLSSIIPVDLYYHISVIWGVCPYIYDRRNQRVRISRWLGIYSILLHGSCICLIGPLMILIIENNETDQTLVTDLAHILEFANVIIKVTSIALSMFIFFKNRLTFERASNEILRLNSTTFKFDSGSEDEKIHEWLMRIVFFKVAVTV